MSRAMRPGVAAWLLGFTHFLPVLALVAALVIWLHRANIARLRAGTEPRVGSKKAADAE